MDKNLFNCQLLKLYSNRNADCLIVIKPIQSNVLYVVSHMKFVFIFFQCLCYNSARNSLIEYMNDFDITIDA